MAKKENRQYPKSVVITAILCIAGLEAYAMYLGINGKLFSLAIAAMAGLAGWALPQLKLK